VSAKPWILATDGSNPEFPFGFACLRCGVKKALDGHGIPMAEYVKGAKAFRKEHIQCHLSHVRSGSNDSSNAS
jgi:hypothetical protein